MLKKTTICIQIYTMNFAKLGNEGAPWVNIIRLIKIKKNQIGLYRGKMEGSKSPKIIKLETDYLVIGSGAMGMAFVDEMLIGSSNYGNNQNTEFIIIDKHAKPGGHWNDAYQFVTLHQPAAFYGVNSKFLGEGIN